MTSQRRLFAFPGEVVPKEASAARFLGPVSQPHGVLLLWPYVLLIPWLLFNGKPKRSLPPP